jgi:hypothetical protein
MTTPNHMSQAIRITGVPGIRATLKELPRIIERRVVADASRNIARKVAREIKSVAPRSRGDRSPASKKYGQIYRNIKAVKKYNTLWFVNIGDSFWGRMLEYGTSLMSAKPWFRPKWDSIKTQTEASYVGEIGRQIIRQAERAAARNAGKK